MTTLFISDLHLDGSRPAATKAFLKFLAEDAPSAEKLYILGDLFEAWIGDDDPNPHHQQVIAALAKLGESDTPCFFIPGNRDFLVGKHFLGAAKMILLPDPTLIYVGGESVQISHGDIYCTDDLSYQRYRRFVHHPLTMRIYRALPFFIRRMIIDTARGQSQASTQYKSSKIMDVNQGAIEETLKENRVNILLHGHTHRPAFHDFELAGEQMRRIVLGDWYKYGSVLRWDDNGPELLTLEF
jgi:UDP-2,3-diacylglucosamine hydrolase